jgi:Thioredoxin
MNPELVRTGIILALALAVSAVVLLARWRIRRRQARVLTASATALPPLAGGDAAPVRILVFSSDDCAQCHRLQAPAIQKVLAARGSSVAVTEVDAPTSPELTERYQILTLPSTAILDVTGKTHAINYGFANSTKLLQQVDHVLAMERAEAAV